MQNRAKPCLDSVAVAIGVLPLTLTLVSCVITYQGFPSVDLAAKPFSYENQNVSYVVAKNMSEGVRLVRIVHESFSPLAWLTDGDYIDNIFGDKVRPSRTADVNLVELIENAGALPGPVPSGASSTKGMQIPIWVEYSTVSPYESFEHVRIAHYFFSAITFTVVPITSAKEYRVNYGIVVDDDGHPRQTYTYRFRKKTLGGVLLLPFVWMNGFTYDERDALRATFYQFLLDAEHDGYLTRVRAR